MKRFSLLLLLVACGGKLFGSEAPPQEAGTDANDPLGGGGNQLAGTCHFTSSFRPNGGDWIYQTDADGTSTAKRPMAGTFTLLCAGKGNEGFYYELATEAVTTMGGTYTTQGQLTQVSNGREAEVTDWGACSLVVQSIAPAKGHDVVTGTFDCENLKTLTGTFLIKGSFSVPLP